MVVHCKNNIRIAGNGDKTIPIARCSVAFSEKIDNVVIKHLDKAAKNCCLYLVLPANDCMLLEVFEVIFTVQLLRFLCLGMFLRCTKHLQPLLTCRNCFKVCQVLKEGMFLLRNMHFKGLVCFTRTRRRTEIKDLITWWEQQKLETDLPWFWWQEHTIQA